MWWEATSRAGEGGDQSLLEWWPSKTQEEEGSLVSPFFLSLYDGPIDKLAHNDMIADSSSLPPFDCLSPIGEFSITSQQWHRFMQRNNLYKEAIDSKILFSYAPFFRFTGQVTEHHAIWSVLCPIPGTCPHPLPLHLGLFDRGVNLPENPPHGLPSRCPRPHDHRIDCSSSCVSLSPSTGSSFFGDLCMNRVSGKPAKYRNYESGLHGYFSKYAPYDSQEWFPEAGEQNEWMNKQTKTQNVSIETTSTVLPHVTSRHLLTWTFFFDSTIDHNMDGIEVWHRQETKRLTNNRRPKRSSYHPASSRK